MQACLLDPADGYYVQSPSLGETGDFITAPMVSQIFGEVIGLWAVEAWVALGRPRPFRLIELGPGHGLMMRDALRAARVVPDFIESAEVWLVEVSELLRQRQAEALGAISSPRWASSLGEVTPGPAIILANEFLDCLPVNQAVLGPQGWRERLIGLGLDCDLAFQPGGEVRPCPDWGKPATGTVAEWSPALADFGRAIGARLTAHGGAGLFVDYGRDAPGLGDTLQAVRGHRKEHPLANPGRADLTAHVDFPGFLAAARQAGAATSPIRCQGDFLRTLGAEIRAAQLSLSHPDRAEVLARQLARLVAADQMGALFKVGAVHTPGLVVPGFEGP
jgi:SAM-dependent MidA family methyltransferase